jgi:hypothetical protein
VINDVFDCRPFLTKFCDSYDELSKTKLRPSDWEALEKIRLILRPFKKFTEYVSHEEPLIQQLATMYTEVGIVLRKINRKEGEFARINDDLVKAVGEGISTFNKYFSYLKDSDFYYLATVFDPRIKTEWIKKNIDRPNDVIERIRDLLNTTYPT